MLTKLKNTGLVRFVGFRVAKVTVANFNGPRDSGCELVSDTGETILLILTAGCCSNSYFEAQSVRTLESLEGREIRTFRVEYVDAYDFRGDYSRLYVLVIEHDLGSETVDWRNESNGYYDGDLEISVSEGVCLERDPRVSMAERLKWVTG